MDGGSEEEVWEQSSNPNRVRFVHLRAKRFVKGMNPSPQNYGLNSINCIRNSHCYSQKNFHAHNKKKLFKLPQRVGKP